MQQYNLSPPNVNILFNTNFYAPKLKYYSTLDYLPITELKKWISTIKNNDRKNTVQCWLNQVYIYLNILDLLQLSHQIVYSQDIYQLMVKSSLITFNTLNKDTALLLLKEYLKEANSDNIEEQFLLSYSKSSLGVCEQNFSKFFSKVNTLSYLEKEYFYKMFYYFPLDDTQLTSIMNNYRFVEKCINTWTNVCSHYSKLTIQDYLKNYLHLTSNDLLIECILDPNLINSLKVKLSVENQLKCEDILGISIKTDFSEAKKRYLFLIKENHPDKHPEQFKLYSEKTSKINLAWNEWKKYHNELQTE